tara:strand:+ start:318 stop:2618 length:2301 start_codon:yes stop_codon:yes gene_type:complete
LHSPTNLSSLIWSSGDDVLRGLFNRAEFGKVILPFIVLRRIDCVLEDKKELMIELHNKYKNVVVDPSQIIERKIGLPFYNISNFDLKRMTSDPNNLFLNFNNYIEGYSKNIRDIIRHFSLEQNIKKLNTGDRLYTLIKKFTEFDLRPEIIDNHQMGSIYEEILRRFSELSNQESGDYYTPRDVVKLLVSVIFSEESDLTDEGLIRTIYDPCCGSGGMLTIAKEWILQNYKKNTKVELFGQTLMDESYAICKSDFLILGEDPKNIGGPSSTLSDDKFPNHTFNYMLTNPPFGISWKSDEKFVKDESKNKYGRFSNGIPWIKDGQLLFLSHMISKMDPNGSVIGIVTNGSTLTTGDGNRGESQFRKYLVEKDLIDSIYILPDDLFFDTGILSYIWILKNNKIENYKNKIRVFNCIDEFEKLYKPIGDKRKIISKKNIDNIVKMVKSKVKNNQTKVFDSQDFLYNYVTIHKKQKNIDGSYRRNIKNEFIPKPGESEKIKLKLDIDINNYIQNLNQGEDLFFNEKDIVVGCEFHLTKFFYKAKKVMPIKHATQNLENSLSNFFSKKNLFGFDVKEVQVNSEYWFGYVPEKWQLIKIDQCFSLRSTKVDQLNYKPLSVTKSGIVPQLEHVAKSNDSGNRYLVKADDFVINSRSDRRGSSGISNYEGSVSSVNIVLEPNKSILNPYYIHNLLRTKEFQEEFYRHGKGIVDDLWSTSWSEMREIYIPIPPLIEQNNICIKLKNLEEMQELLLKINSEFKPFEESLKSFLVFKK